MTLDIGSFGFKKLSDFLFFFDDLVRLETAPTGSAGH